MSITTRNNHGETLLCMQFLPVTENIASLETLQQFLRICLNEILMVLKKNKKKYILKIKTYSFLACNILYSVMSTSKNKYRNRCHYSGNYLSETHLEYNLI